MRDASDELGEAAHGSMISGARETRMTIFQKIIDRQIPAKIIYETDDVLAFRDINPQAPTHVVVIPKRAIPRLAAGKAEDAELLGKLLLACAEVARMEGLEGRGYRVVTNNGADAGQTVEHIHFHVIGGRHLGWPPG
jgi:histidine triad (HIT) family protein